MVSTQMDLGIDLSGFGNIRFSFFEYFLRKTKTKTANIRELKSYITRFFGHFLRFFFGIAKHDLANREIEKKHSSNGAEGKKPGSD